VEVEVVLYKSEVLDERFRCQRQQLQGGCFGGMIGGWVHRHARLHVGCESTVFWLSMP
jgi:hypothetical protein